MPKTKKTKSDTTGLETLYEKHKKLFDADGEPVSEKIINEFIVIAIKNKQSALKLLDGEYIKLFEQLDAEALVSK